MRMNHYGTTMSTILALLMACCAGLAVADQQLPETYQDDLYHCQDPTYNQNPIRCDPETYLWDLGDLNPNEQPDDSLLCNEIVKILVKAREQQGLNPGQEQAQETQEEVELWETIMETSVVDQLEPCVLWAVSFGPLTPYAESMGLYEERGPKATEAPEDEEEVWEEVGVFEDVGVKQPVEEEAVEANKGKDNDKKEKPVDTDDTSDPISTMLETEFDSFMIGIAWTVPLGHAISLDRTELHEITGRHILDALKAELGSDKVAHLDLTLTASPPDYDAQILPLTLSGRVVFGDHLEALGSTNLQKLILKSAFVDDNARDLYLFRLKLSKDDTLQTVSTVVVGKEDIAVYILQEPSRNHDDKKSKPQFIETDLSEEDEGFVSKLLIAILAAVGAAILAVVLFAYFLICRSKTSGKATKTLEEHSSSAGSGPSASSFRKVQSLRKQQKQQQAYKDGVPAVRTAPTEDVIEEEESQYDIEYMAGSNDGVSEYDMDTLPPPSTLPDSDDDQSVVMSVMEGFDDENVQETVAGNTLSDDSDANASLYSYIPSDTSLSMSLTKEPTAMEKAQKKGILWSVDKQQKAADDMENYSYDLSAEQSYESPKPRTTSMLGPSDDDTQSRDSSLLYATDDEELLSKQKIAEIPADYEPEESAPVEDDHPPIVESKSADEDEEVGDDDKKKKFEDLWKDENEIDEAASVLNYLETVQSARRAAAAENEEQPTSSLTSSLKIIDVATPVQTPERPVRPEDNQMLPLPATLDSAFQDTASVSSSLSGSSAKQSPAAKGDDDNSTRSTRSTDSSKLRRLLGQGDMNDAALVFGKQSNQKDDASSGNEAEVSMSSCTSNQLKSLLTTTDSKDEEDDEDFLFSKSDSRRKVEEEKKEVEEFEDDDDEEDNRRPNYLPAAITPRNQPNRLPKQQRVNNSPADDASVYSALSDAPSVDETIASNMGWF